MPDIFLSYSREDQLTARRFAEGLEHEGFSVWWDATLHSGRRDRLADGDGASSVPWILRTTLPTSWTTVISRAPS